MKTVIEMWAALAAYQPQADAAGHGASWAKMCKEKTYAATAYAAAYAADADAYAAAAYAAYADAYAYAADAAAYADAAAAAEKWAQKAIDSINKVLIKPAQQEPVCGWKREDDDHMPDTWRSDCGVLWTFSDGSPVDNDMKYCLGCGAKLKEKNT